MRNLETLVAWKLARDISRRAYRLTMAPPLRRHYSLADQVRRSAASIPANICEGYALGTRGQLIRCVRIALGSASELKCHLELARDVELVSGSDVDALITAVERLLGVLVGLLKRLGAKVPS